MPKKLIAIIALPLLMAGCAGSHVSTSEVKPTPLPSGFHVRRVVVHLDSTLAHDRVARAEKYHLKHRIESKVRTDLSKGHHLSRRGRIALDINVTQFRLRSGAAAFWLGVMAGADVIAVDVKVEQHGKTLETFHTDTSTALGGFAFPAPSERLNRMVKTLAKRILTDLGAKTS